MRANTPSVTTSMRVLRLILEPRRTRRPTVSPTASPSVCAMRSAAARAASRRGSSTMILPPLDPGLVEQHQRHPRGLAGAGRRDEHRIRPRRAGSPSGRRGRHRWEGGCRKRACRVMAQAGRESKPGRCGARSGRHDTLPVIGAALRAVPNDGAIGRAPAQAAMPWRPSSAARSIGST